MPASEEIHAHDILEMRRLKTEAEDPEIIDTSDSVQNVLSCTRPQTHLCFSSSRIMSGICPGQVDFSYGCASKVTSWRFLKEK